ncbi:hypothetical protein BDQ12DRAFT_765984 [Crucibulum laeve]|uniref:Uncharacterized protein n=1 Tax=Crucibulum laeve TaxID=68775 RepID=A0A5C3LY86_9AGAR|nr:hypothetical protein BDQ12DRAFT_765984 [Crucibulum laeve]
MPFFDDPDVENILLVSSKSLSEEHVPLPSSTPSKHIIFSVFKHATFALFVLMELALCIANIFPMEKSTLLFVVTLLSVFVVPLIYTLWTRLWEEDQVLYLLFSERMKFSIFVVMLGAEARRSLEQLGDLITLDPSIPHFSYIPDIILISHNLALAAVQFLLSSFVMYGLGAAWYLAALLNRNKGQSLFSVCSPTLITHR